MGRIGPSIDYRIAIKMLNLAWERKHFQLSKYGRNNNNTIDNWLGTRADKRLWFSSVRALEYWSRMLQKSRQILTIFFPGNVQMISVSYFENLRQLWDFRLFCFQIKSRKPAKFHPNFKNPGNWYIPGSSCFADCRCHLHLPNTLACSGQNFSSESKFDSKSTSQPSLEVPPVVPEISEFCEN